MLKFLLFFIAALMCSITPLAAQKTKTDAAPPPPQQKKPPPYVFKTDYDVKMKEVDGKVSSALGTAIALKNELTGKLDKVDELDAKMMQVEEILNSANFKIATTSDSLKRTNFSVEEFRTDTERKTGELYAATKMQGNLIWGLLGLAVVLFAGVVLMMNGRMKALRSALRRQADEFGEKLAQELDTQQKAYNEEIVQFKMRVQDDLNRVKTELRSSNETTSAQLQVILDKLDNKEG